MTGVTANATANDYCLTLCNLLSSVAVDPRPKKGVLQSTELRSDMRLKLLILIALSLFIVSDLDAQRRTSQRRSDREKATEETQAEKDPLLEEYGFASRDALAEALLEADPSASDRKIIERYRSGEHLTRRQKSRLSSLLEDYKEVQLAAGSEEEKEASGRRAERRERPSREKAARARPERAARESAERSAREKRESARTRERAARTRPSRSARGAARESVDILDSGLDFSFDGTITGPSEETARKTGSGRRRSRSARGAEETAEVVSEITTQIMTKDRRYVYVDANGQLAVSSDEEAFRWQLRPAGHQKVLAFDPVSQQSLAWTESGAVGLTETPEDTIHAVMERLKAAFEAGREGKERGFSAALQWSITFLRGGDVLGSGLIPAGNEQTGIALLFKDDQGLTGDDVPNVGEMVELLAGEKPAQRTAADRRSARRTARTARDRSARTLINTVGEAGNLMRAGDLVELWDEDDNSVVDRAYVTVWEPRTVWIFRLFFPRSWWVDLAEPSVQFEESSSTEDEGAGSAELILQMADLNGLADYQADYVVTHSSRGEVGSGTVSAQSTDTKPAETIEIRILDDLLYYEEETYTVTLQQKSGGNAILGEITTHTVTVTNNDAETVPSMDDVAELDRLQENLDSLVAKAEGVQDYTEPALAAFLGVEGVVGGISVMQRGAGGVKTALGIARRIPYVGPLFRAPYSVVSPLPATLRRLRTTACRVDESLDPIETMIERIDDLMEVIALRLAQVGSLTRQTYGLLSFARECASGYTITAAANLGGSGCTGDRPCISGEGDCDNDAQCSETLACNQRTYGEPVAGIFFPAGFPDHYDLCYDTGPLVSGIRAVNLGGSGCTAGKPCDSGEGDCDRDSDCAGDLACYQRSAGESVVGINFFDNFPDDYDICYDPSGQPGEIDGGTSGDNDHIQNRGKAASGDIALANTIAETQVQYLQGVTEAANVVEEVNDVLNAVQAQMAEIVEAMETGLSITADYQEVIDFLEPLEPLTDVLTEEVTIDPWPASSASLSCPSGGGWTDMGLYCDRCPSGFSRALVGCVANECPSGYTDYGVLCVRCPSGYINIGAMCKKDDWWDPRLASHRSITRPTRSIQTTDMVCPPDYTHVGVACIRGSLTISIEDITDALDDAIHAIDQLGIGAVVEGVIEDVVSEALGPIMDELGVPDDFDDLLPEFDPGLDPDVVVVNLEDQFEEVYDTLNDVAERLESTISLMVMDEINLSAIDEMECLRGREGAMRAELIRAALNDKTYELRSTMQNYRTATAQVNGRQYSPTNACGGS